MHLYEIGPVTGIENDNLPAFIAAEKSLKAAGHFVDIPHRWVLPNSPWDKAMADSIRRMMTMWGNAIQLDEEFGLAMLDSWNESRGAVIEYTLAQQLNIPCKPWRVWL